MGDRELLLEKLRQQTEYQDDGYMTSHEIMAAMNWSEKRTAGRLRELHLAGEIEVAKVRRLNIVGICAVVPGYKRKNGKDGSNV